jgi:hypothetical protein
VIPSLEPIAGDPDAVEGKAVQLKVMALRFHRANDVLTVLTTSADWAGPAGTAFAERVSAMPRLLASVAERLGQAASALEEFAPAMRQAQRLCDRAVDDHGEESRALRRIDDDMAQARSRGAGPEADRLATRRLACVLRLDDAERRHAAALAAFDEADQRCAARLFQAARDALRDPPAYTAATGVAGLAEAAAGGAAQAWWLPGVGEGAEAMALVGGATSVLLRSAVKAFYDEGSWKDIGVNGAMFAVSPLARGLRAAGLRRAGAEPARLGQAVDPVPSTLAQLRDRRAVRAWAQETILSSGELRLAREAAEDLSRVSGAHRAARWSVNASVGLRFAHQGCTRAGQLHGIGAAGGPGPGDAPGGASGGAPDGAPGGAPDGAPASACSQPER